MGEHERAELERVPTAELVAVPAGPMPGIGLHGALSPGAVLALQQGAGNQSVSRMLATRDFEIAGRQHTLSARPGPGGVELIMASTPEDVRLKLARFEATVANYIARLEDGDLDDQVKQGSFLADLKKLRSDVERDIGGLRSGTWKPSRYKTNDDGFTTVGKGKKGAKSGAVDDQSKIDADATALENAISGIDAIAGRLAQFAASAGIEGLDAVDVEAWAHQQFMESRVYGKQQEVADVIGPHVAAIANALPGARVKFRGSLARGLKSFRKPGPHGAVQRFDPSNFDADAFIEVPDDMWDIMDGWDPGGLGSKVKLAPLIVLAERRRAPMLAALRAVQRIEGQIRKGLGAVQGYTQSRGSAEFYFVVQSASASADQIEDGNPYPEGALAQSGMPAIEGALPYTRNHREIGGPAVFTGEIHVEIDEHNERSQDMTEDAPL